MTEDASKPEVRELVFEYLERLEEGTDPDALLDAFCERHPGEAAAIRQRVDVLRRSRLIDAGDEDMPERLGEFRLLECIGDGGMGVVYRAVDERLDREVAVKLIRPGELYFPGARERFRREVQTIARLAHPGIVPVYSVGEERGVPYFAMERVQGATLGQILQQVAGRDPAKLRGSDFDSALAKLTGQEQEVEPAPQFAGTWTEACTRILREVADALEHAHRRGVLHRDVKPSNVMLARDGRVMLLDFGLSTSEGNPRLTRTRSALGSLPYMSPEQLDGDWDALDARSDVYSLGVTLYELCALRLPFPGRDVVSMRTAIAEGAATPLRGRNPTVSWELETICAAAMDPDPARRYASAAALAADLGAVLEGRAIHARPASWPRRLTRFVQRRPARALALLLTGLLLVGGPLLFGLQERRAKLLLASEQAETERQALRAERNFKSALSAVDTMLTRIAEEDLLQVPRLSHLRRELLERALGFYLGFLEEREGGLGLKAESANAWYRVGEMYGLLDRTSDARAAFERSASELSELLEVDPGNTKLIDLRAQVLGRLALVRRRLGRDDDSLAALSEKAALLESLPTDVSSPTNPNLDRLSVELDLAEAERLKGQLDSALSRAEAVAGKLEGLTNPDAQAKALLGRAFDEQGLTLSTRLVELPRTRHRAHAELVLEAHMRALEVRDELHAAYPEMMEARRDLMRSQFNVGLQLGILERFEESRSAFERSAELSEGLVSDYPSIGTFRMTHGMILSTLAACMAVDGDFDDAEALAQESIDQLDALAKEQPDHVDVLEKRMQAITQGAMTCLRAKRFDAALKHGERALRVLEEFDAAYPGRVFTASNFDQIYFVLADTHLKLEDHIAASEVLLALVARRAHAPSQVRAARFLTLCAASAEADTDLSMAERADYAAEYDEAAIAMLLEAFEHASPQVLMNDEAVADLRKREAIDVLLSDVLGH